MVGMFEAWTVCWRESTRRVQLSGNQAAVDRVRHVAVEDLVLSQVDKPKRRRSALFKYAQDNSPWFPAQMLHTTSCSAVVWSQSYLSSHSLINNLIVCI